MPIDACEDVRRRIIIQFLDLIFLDMLSAIQKPKSKKYLVDRVYDLSGIQVDDGLALPLLLMLERQRLIKGRSREVHGMTKRFYKITAKGIRTLKVYRDCYDDALVFVALLFKTSKPILQ
jgi:DNA-binding PadR family transcriptional regulator